MYLSDVGGPFVVARVLLSNACYVSGYVVIVLWSVGCWTMSWGPKWSLVAQRTS